MAEMLLSNHAEITFAFDDKGQQEHKGKIVRFSGGNGRYVVKVTDAELIKGNHNCDEIYVARHCIKTVNGEKLKA